MHRCQRNLVSKGTIAKAMKNSEITIYEGTSPVRKKEASSDFFGS